MTAQQQRGHPAWLCFAIWPLALLLAGGVAWVALSRVPRTRSLAPLDPHRFSAGEVILVPRDPWLMGARAGEGWQQTCQNHWPLKEQKKFQAFVARCPQDAEASIYRNNQEATWAANTAGERLATLAVAVPISRDAGRGVFDALEILRGASLAQQAINVVAIPLSPRTHQGFTLNWRASMAYDATMALATGIGGASRQCLARQTLTNACIRTRMQAVLRSPAFRADGILGKHSVQFDGTGDRKTGTDPSAPPGEGGPWGPEDPQVWADQLGALVCVTQQGRHDGFVPLKPGQLCS